MNVFVNYLYEFNFAVLIVGLIFILTRKNISEDEEEEEEDDEEEEIKQVKEVKEPQTRSNYQKNTRIQYISKITRPRTIELI